MSLVMFDSVDVSQIPAGAQAVAGYVSGRFVTYPHLLAAFPRAHVLSIAVSATADAQCLDIEQGDATPAQAVAWYERQRHRGVARPCLYASAFVMDTEVIPAIRAAGIGRQAVRLWSAHYNGSPHICGPGSCKELGIDADGTQWTDRAMGGRNLDESLLAADFFGTPPATGWTAAMINDLPLVKQGDIGNDVRTVQALCIARGHAVAVDGDFGNATAAAVRAVQASYGISVDSVVGPQTWAVLITGAP